MSLRSAGNNVSHQPDRLLANQTVGITEAAFCHRHQPRFTPQPIRQRPSDTQRLLAQGAVRGRCHLFHLFQFDPTQTFEAPKRANAQVSRSGIIHQELCEFRRQ